MLAWFSLYKKGAFAHIKDNIDAFLASVIYRDKQESNGQTLANVLSFLGLLLLIYGLWRIKKTLGFPGKWALVPVLGATLIIAAGAKAWANRIILSNKVAVWFGFISFPLYLWHWPILSYGRIVYSERPPIEFRLLAVFASILLAWLTVKFIEKPFRFGKQRNRLKVATLCCSVLVMGFLGFLVS